MNSVRRGPVRPIPELVAAIIKKIGSEKVTEAGYIIRIAIIPEAVAKEQESIV